MESESKGAELTSTSLTMVGMLKLASNKHPQNPAIIAMHQPPALYTHISSEESGSQHLLWTHSQLERGAKLLAIALQDQGLKAGDPVAVFLDNVAEWALVLYACLMLNCPFVNCNPRSTQNETEIRHVLDTSQAQALVATDTNLVHRLKQAASGQFQRIKLVAIPGHSHGTVKGPAKSSIEILHIGDMVSGISQSEHVEARMQKLEDIPHNVDDPVIVFYTSGTTSLPKGCVHTNRSFTASLQSYAISLSATSDSVMCLNHAVNFVSGPLFTFTFLTSGAAVVIPAHSFDSSASLRAVERYQCSHMGTVTTMLKMCLDNPKIRSTNVSSLRIVFCGGSSVLHDHVKRCHDLLGASLIVIYSLTEAPVTLNGHADPMHQSAPSAGHAAPGVCIRICDPETSKIVLRGTPGEIHQSGPCVVREYIGNASPESFYEEDGIRWFRTGDEAIMDDSGEVQITGRYKDLILRGGANLSPATIEDLISKEFDLDSQVVAIPDEYAGELPVAVVSSHIESEVPINSIKQKVVAKLGKNYALVDVIPLSELGLASWPLTTSGKVRKVELRQKVKSHRSKDATPSQDKDILKTIKKIWAEVMGVAEDDITDQTSVQELGDSLTVSVLANRLQQTFAHPLSVQDLIQNSTLLEQRKMIQSMTANPFSDLESNRIGPPRAQDMIHTYGETKRAAKTKEICEPFLAELGLTWSSHVKDVMPMHDGLRILTDFYPRRGIDIRQTWVAVKETSTERLQHAIETALRGSDMMRATAVPFDERTELLVVIRDDAEWYKHIFTTLDHPVKTVTDLGASLAAQGIESGPYGRPFVRFVLGYIEETKTAGFVCVMHHAVMDGTSVTKFWSDVELSLKDSNHEPLPRVPYKLYADEKYALRSSTRAQALVSEFKREWKGIRHKVKQFIPSPFTSRWVPGPNMTEAKKTVPDDLSNQDIGQLNDSKWTSAFERRQIPLQDMNELQVKHIVPPATLGKASLVLFMSEQTQEDVVLLCDALSGRNSWPYSPDWMSKRLPSVMDIDGCCFGFVPSVSIIKQDQSVLSFLQQQRKHQEGLVRMSHVPISALADALNADDPEDATYFSNAMYGVGFNWLGGATDALATKGFEPSLTLRANVVECHYAFGIGMAVDPAMQNLSLGCYSAIATPAQTETMYKGIGRMAEELSKKENWSLSVREFMSRYKGDPL